MSQHLCTVHKGFTIPGQAFVPRPEVSLFILFALKSVFEASFSYFTKPLACRLRHILISQSMKVVGLAPKILKNKFSNNL